MKKFLIASFFTMFLFQLHAQDGVPSKSVYLEVGGPGMPYSFNYDFRFDSENMNSWGMRIGAGGYTISEGESFFSLPIMANKLYGNGPHYFEFGMGMTFFAFNEDQNQYCLTGYYDQNSGQYICTTYEQYPFNFILDVDGSPSVMGMLNFGYRKVPVDGGFTWKVNINPLFNNNGFWPLFAGVGFGYAF
ncbi:hypothetical protein SAMN04487988_106225 [Algoriphagus hitonicola]|uniref:Outer membrane protein beta-barrel domain-containing protein n=1 Tax=Algoriphagus hitonicola TaxID=435880 RepID=A0A1I2U290_9BACT|nr:hypothetical protein [Algoriphagus hitonicola]SFG68691.1 hypothetical protein SAMN04487988_106225 [Algoriphagus hitonicola]